MRLGNEKRALDYAAWQRNGEEAQAVSWLSLGVEEMGKKMAVAVLLLSLPMLKIVIGRKKGKMNLVQTDRHYSHLKVPIQVATKI